MATVLVSVTDATTNEALHRASIEMRHADQIVWSSGGTPADRKGIRRAVLDDVPEAATTSSSRACVRWRATRRFSLYPV